MLEAMACGIPVAEHYAMDHMQTQWQRLFDGG